jgi:hypothetical protein
VRGLLARRHIRIVPEQISYIVKESNRLEEVETELEHCVDDVLQIFEEPRKNGLSPEVLEVLKRNPSRKLARIAGVSERSIRAIRNGHSQPKQSTLKRLNLFLLKAINRKPQV